MPDRLQEIRARLDAATPGPWRVMGRGNLIDRLRAAPGLVTADDVYRDLGFAGLPHEHMLRLDDPELDRMTNYWGGWRAGNVTTEEVADD